MQDKAINDQGRIQDFSWGGGGGGEGAQKIMTVCAFTSWIMSAKSEVPYTAEVQGPLRGSEAFGVFYALLQVLHVSEPYF